MPRELQTSSADFEAAFQALLAAKRETDADVSAAAQAIIDEVRAKGDSALIALTKRFDRLELTPATLRVAPSRLEAAIGQCGNDTLAALDLAAQRIRAFHEAQKPTDLAFTDAQGVRLGLRWRPLESVGLYVPGGTAAYPSSVLMNAIPAKVAGVERLAMVVPAPDGQLNPLVLAAARLAQVDEIFTIGGAQAVAALAYGTQTIRPVDKIVGPGNAYVAAAKRLVFGQVGIDMIAGPSEILVVADAANNPDWIAADLMSQAEHDTAAQAILITDDRAFAAKVGQAVEALLDRLPRAEIARASWQAHGALIVVDHLDQALALIDRVAPEHLELALPDPDRLASRVRHAGAIFLGRHTPEAVGDYVGGPNHVLPTARSARFSSGLGVVDFLKRTTLLGCDATAIRAIGPAAVTLAKAEGLDAHALSVALRLE
ncbi:MAG: histidinol dehydrogenase [Rhodospirillales bacterium]|nr:histidinol dehydrogenase [Rhodospirillales bacterium]